MQFNNIYHITRFMCARILKKLKPTFLLWFIKRSSVHMMANLANLDRFQYFCTAETEKYTKQLMHLCMY